MTETQKTTQQNTPVERDPFNQGVLAATMGKTIDDNPHWKTPESKTCKGWLRGFRFGRENPKPN